MLNSISYRPLYRSFSNDFDREFMIPSYQQSIRLDRGSGYFSLKSLMLSMEGIIEFLGNNGHIRLVCNPELSQSDIDFIELGNSLEPSHITSDLIRSIDSTGELSAEEVKKMDVVCNMIAEGRLVIKIAFMPTGIYHEKFGIFMDEEGNSVYFNGSVNETVSAKLRNMESFTVLKSWDGNESTIRDEAAYFESLWENMNSEVLVISFPDAVQRHLFENYKKSESLEVAISHFKGQTGSSEKRELWEYQQKAVNGFVENSFRHFYEMATGTGKTFTAIKTIERLRNEIVNNLFVIICVPQIDLQANWAKELEKEGHSKLYLLGGLNDGIGTDQDFDKAVISYNRKKESIVICIAIYDTFFSRYYNKLSGIQDLMVLFDEAHNLSPAQIKKLPEEAKYRLGLSATIERFNPLETKGILSYFLPEGKNTFFYGIEDAIENKYLSRYEYHPIFVRLSEPEFAKYQSKTKQIATLLSEDDPDMEEVNKRRMERSLIVKQASYKLLELDEMILNKDVYNFKNAVVYCGAGKSEDAAIIDAVTVALHNYGHYRVSQFTSKTIDRVSVLHEFENGFYDTLVAIRCFDEGVDCPKLDKIYIMSSETSLRQTVQRRGRVLRKCRETGKTLAYIYDMIILPPSDFETGMGVTSLIVNELTRAKEYARLAENKEANMAKFQEIEKTFYITEADYVRETQTD